MAGQAEPEQVAVDALQLQEDCADELCPRWNFDPSGDFSCLTVTRTVNAPSYSANAFGQEGHLVIGERRVGQLLDAAMIEEAAIVHADDLLAFDE